MLFKAGLRMNSRIVQMIRQFGDEHKIFKGTFIFKDMVSFECFDKFLGLYEV
jgi:hypothetical protein